MSCNDNQQAMKKSTILLSVVVLTNLFFACGNNNNTVRNAPANSELVNKASDGSSSNYSEGASLIAKSDCLTCHSKYEKKTGPSFVQIADKYHHDQKLADYLTNSVVKGSFGIFGSEKMTPHDNISVDDITKMTHYILSVRSEGK